MTTPQNPPGPKVLSLLKAAVPVQNANDLASELRALALQVEAQNKGYLSECPNQKCRAINTSEPLCFAFVDIGAYVVSYCYAGCDTSESLSIYGEAVQLRPLWQEGRTGPFSREEIKLASELLPVPKSRQLPQAVPLKEFLALTAPPRVELCGPWLREQTITEVYGWRGAGKSWFCLHLAYCVSAGVGFMKWAGPTEPKRVVYVDGEMGLDDVQERLKKFIQAEEHKAGRELESKLCILSDSNLKQFPDGIPKLSTPAGRALIEAQLSHGPTVLFLDNLSILFNSAIENDAESWCEAQDWFISLRRRGHSVVFIHHAGKGGNQRGTSKREDACNNVIALKQPEDHQASDGATFLLKFEKSRGVHGPPVDPFEAKLTTDEHGSLVWALAAKEPSKAEKIEALLLEGLRSSEVIKQGFTSSQVYKVAALLSKKTKASPLSKQPTDVSSPLPSGEGSSKSSPGAFSSLLPPRRGKGGESENPQARAREERGERRGEAEEKMSANHHQQNESFKVGRGETRGEPEERRGERREERGEEKPNLRGETLRRPNPTGVVVEQFEDGELSLVIKTQPGPN